jgi:hypothetical protein
MMIGTVMMTNTIQQQSQPSQHHAGNPTSLNASKHSHHQSNRDYSATQQKYEAQFAHQQQQHYQQQQQQQQPYLSDTDMSEVRSTIAREKKKSRSSNRHQQHDHGTRTGSVVSFDHSTSTTVQSQQHHQSSRHHQRRHQPSAVSNSNPKRLTQSSRHNSSRSVNFDANKIQQQQPPPPPNQHDEPYDTVIADNNKATDDDDNDGRIQVQILPQDDNWGANTTTYTAATSEVSDYNDDMTEDGRSRKDEYFDQDVDADGRGRRTKFDMCRLCSRYGGFMFAVLIVMCTYVTPILFIVLPRIPAIANWQVSDCGIECEGLLIGIAFKLFLLLLGIWALYLRKPKATMPRVYELRVLILFLLCILTFAYWLFYGVRIIDTRQPDYYKILQFTVTYVDVLLFVYIIAVFILEIRHMQPQYVVKIVRSPDGEQTEYTLGKMSIQRAAVWLLEQYYKDFKVYNPWLDNAHKRRANLMEGASVKGKKGF